VTYFSTKQLSEFWNIPERTLRERLQRGDLVGVKFGKLWKIPGSSVSAEFGHMAPAEKKPTTLTYVAHVECLFDWAQELRQYVHDRRPEWEAYEGRGSSWLLSQRDWRLVPHSWFWEVAPDLKDRQPWEKAYPGLLDHLTHSQFLLDYEELRQQTVQLDRAIRYGVARVRHSREGFFARWKTASRDAAWLLETIRAPNALQSGESPTHDILEPRFVKETLEMIDSVVPSFRECYRHADVLLDRLTEDLQPGAINPTFEQSTCGHCIGEFLRMG